jgi:hypothetical protein
MRGQREREKLAHHWMGGAKVGGGVETSTRSAYPGEGEVEKGATLPPSFPPCATPPHRDVVPWQTGFMAHERQLKHPEHSVGRLPACCRHS